MFAPLAETLTDNTLTAPSTPTIDTVAAEEADSQTKPRIISVLFMFSTQHLLYICSVQENRVGIPKILTESSQSSVESPPPPPVPDKKVMLYGHQTAFIAS